MKRFTYKEEGLLRLAMPLLLLFSVMVAPGQAAAQVSGFSVRALASSRPGAADAADSRLRDLWGMTRMRSGPWWIAAGAGGRVIPYSGDGTAVPLLSPLSVTVPASPGTGFEYASPSGIAFNPGAGFDLGPSEPAWFVIATREGQVDGWFPGGNGNEASVLTDQGPEAGFTGAAIGGDRLYLANFRQDRIDVFDSGMTRMDLGASPFTDPSLPEGLSPYNVRVLQGSVYVAFAAPDDEGRFAAPGAGQVAVFDGSGRYQFTLQPGPWMSAPWGMAIAPEGFGGYGNDILVAESGSGRIAVFDPVTAGFRGYLRDPQGAVIVIPGLHDIGFGNDDTAGPSSVLYYTAGSGGAGSFGAVYPAP
jgi:uncharacterized protein (TIGR03118 family)